MIGSTNFTTDGLIFAVDALDKNSYPGSGLLVQIHLVASGIIWVQHYKLKVQVHLVSGFNMITLREIDIS